MLHQCNEHGGHTHHSAGAVGLGQFEHETRFERRHEYLGACQRSAAEHRHDTSGGVEEGHLGDDDSTFLHAEPFEEVVGVRHQTSVVQRCPLREAGRARRVLDHHLIVGGDRREFGRRVAAGKELVPVGKAHDLLEIRALGVNLLGDGQHRVAAMIVDNEQRLGVRLAHDVLQLRRLVRRVDRHDRHPGERATELEQHPFGQVVGPDGHMVTGLVGRQQRPCRALGVVEQLGVGPLSSGLRVGHSFDQGDAIRGPLGCGAKQVTDRDVEDSGGFDPVGVGFRQSHATA